MPTQKEVANVAGPLSPVAHSRGVAPPLRIGKASKASLLLKRSEIFNKSEEALVERLKTGDREAFDAAFNLYSPNLFKIAHKILDDAGDTEEVVQDVFWAMFKKVKTFRGNSRFSTWLYRLTVNAALGQLRRRSRRKEVPYEDFLPQFQKDGHHLVRPVVDWSANMDECYAKRELHRFLKEALDQLRPMDKTTVILSDLEGFSDREVAETLGLTVSAAKTRLHRARLFLRGKLAVLLGHSPA